MMKMRRKVVKAGANTYHSLYHIPIHPYLRIISLASLSLSLLAGLNYHKFEESLENSEPPRDRLTKLLSSNLSPQKQSFRAFNSKPHYNLLYSQTFMSKIFTNSWGDHVALAVNVPADQALVQQINGGAFNNHNDGAIQLAINNLQAMFGEELQVTKMMSFKTPLSELQWTSLIGYHEYAVFETINKEKRIYWSAEVDGERIWLSAFDSFEKCRDFGPTNEKRYKSQYWKPILKRKAVKPSCYDFYDMVRWIYQEVRNKKDYSPFRNHSKYFISNLFHKFN